LVFMISLLLIVLCAAATSDGGETIVTTLDGGTIKGAIETWNGREITLQAAEGAKTLARSELLDLRWPREVSEAPAALWIELIDGSRLTYSNFTLAERQATIKGGAFEQPVELAREQIKLVQLQPSTPALSAALAEIERKNAAGDSLVIAKNDGASMDYLNGVLGDVSQEEASFEWDGSRLAVKRTRIAAAIFFQAKPPALPEPVCELSLVDGSRVIARKVELNEGRVHVETSVGVELELPLEKVARADFSAGKVVYLSDLKPTEVRWTPRVAAPPSASAIAAFGLPRNDVSFSGSPLSLLWKDDVERSRRDVRTYGKGLAIRSRTELSYRLPEGMRRFVATAGIDPNSASQGHVVLEIRSDERILWEGAVDGKHPPMEIDVQLGAARRLQLRVDYGENLDYGDRLHLVEARVTK
jgi:hypothetical protein